MKHPCPECSWWFPDGTELMEHLEKDHGWTKQQRLRFVEKTLDRLSQGSARKLNR